MEWISIIIAVISATFSIVTYVKTFIYEKRKTTIEYFNTLQNEVLDKLVSIETDNAVTIVENLDNEEIKKAFDDYRALIARLEHFAVGVNKKIYDYTVVDNVAGEHLVNLYEKIKPIIDKANEGEKKADRYSNYVKLVKKLNCKYGIEIEENTHNVNI